MRKRNWYVVIATCALAGVFAFWWLWPLLTEEIFFLGIWMPLHESVRGLHEVQENDRDLFATTGLLTCVVSLWGRSRMK